MLVALLVLSFASCGTQNVAKSGTATVVIENRDKSFTSYDVDLSLVENREEGALSLLEHIASLEGSTLYFSTTYGGGYGAYVASIGSLTPAAGEYVALYTTNESDFAIPTEWAPTVKTALYGEKTLTFSGVGISSMNIEDGTVVLFRIETY